MMAEYVNNNGSHKGKRSSSTSFHHPSSRVAHSQRSTRGPRESGEQRQSRSFENRRRNDRKNFNSRNSDVRSSDHKYKRGNQHSKWDDRTDSNGFRHHDSHNKRLDKSSSTGNERRFRGGKRNSYSSTKKRYSPDQNYRSRDERSSKRANKDPQIPEWVDPRDLPSDIRRDLHMLSRENANRVASHMIASYALIDEDPKEALAHAKAARDHAGRIAVVREHTGIIAYRTGHWQEALSELRTARRIGGGPGMLSLMADCERGLGRPERAIEMLNSEYVKDLDETALAELRIVVAGAHEDMDEYDAAIAVLEKGNLDPSQVGDTAVRYFYAYADALLAAGDKDKAIDWFQRVVAIDDEVLTDAVDRLEELEN